MQRQQLRSHLQEANADVAMTDVPAAVIEEPTANTPVVDWSTAPASAPSFWSRNPPDTPEYVSILGFLLGALFVLGLSTGVHLPQVFQSRSDATAISLWQACKSPQLGLYFASLAVYHMMEYLTTAIYNPEKVKVGCEFT